jgi:ATP-dependent Zn protease
MCSHCGHVRWAESFKHDGDQESIEKEIMVLWGGAVAEELVFGDSRGKEADLADADALLEGVGWLGHNCSGGEEAPAYLRWLQIRTRKTLQKQPSWRKALDAVADELLRSETIDYQTAKRIISNATDRMSPALAKAKKERRS